MDALTARFQAIIRDSPHLMDCLRIARDLDLPDWMIVSGALYNQVWNVLTGRPEMYGVKDVDLFYHDPSDLSWEGEDTVIRRGRALFPAAPPVEIRNQARVHLWYEAHFGVPCAPIRDSRDAVDRFASRTHCVGVRLGWDDGMTVYAPYGLTDIFDLRVVPKPSRPNRPTHEAKAARQKALWPELTVIDWPE